MDKIEKIINLYNLLYPHLFFIVKNDSFACDCNKGRFCLYFLSEENFNVEMQKCFKNCQILVDSLTTDVRREYLVLKKVFT